MPVPNIHTSAGPCNCDGEPSHTGDGEPLHTGDGEPLHTGDGEPLHTELSRCCGWA